MTALQDLEIRIRDDLDRAEAVSDPWLPPPTASDVPHYSTVICGAGLSGLGVAFGLKRRGIGDVLLLDARAPGEEGPWATTARMKTLRSPKHLASVDLGVPSLTMRSWFEARYGADKWDAIEKPSKEDWMAYLIWFRRVSGLSVRNSTMLQNIGRDPEGRGLRLTIKGADGEVEAVSATQLVLATGLDGAGGPRIPEEVRVLPRARYTHSADLWDDTRLRGQEVAVLGGATSSFDWAVTALEQGAARVTLFARRRGLPRTEALAWTNFPGFMGHFADLPDALRWRFMQRYHSLKIPPTQDQYDRAMNDPRFRFVDGVGTTRFALDPDDRIRLENTAGTFHADHLLLGTGYELAPASRPELQSLEGRFLLWKDAYTAPQAEANEALARHPYLGRGFELTPLGAEDDWVSRVHMYNASAVPSLGPICNGITGLKYGVPRLVEALVRRLFTENVDHFLNDFDRYDEAHFDPRELVKEMHE